MNTPNPLVPQGSLQNQSRAKSTVSLAVFTIVAIHAVFFAGLLIQGCKPDASDQSGSPPASTNLADQLPKLTNDFYTAYDQLPSTATPTNQWLTNEAVQTPVPPRPELVSTSAPPAAPVVEPSPEVKEYTVKRGDILYRIASSNRITLKELIQANPGIDPAHIVPGQKILIPVPPAGAGLGMAEPGTPAEAGKTHIVKARENLTRISGQYGLTVKELKAANNLASDRILVGQKLIIPSAKATNGASAMSSNTKPSGTTTQ